MSKKRILLASLLCVILLLTGCDGSEKDDTSSNNVESNETESVGSEITEKESTEICTDETEEANSNETDSSEIANNSSENITSTEDTILSEDDSLQEDNFNKEEISDNTSVEQIPQTPIVQEKKTWFDEKGFQITPWSENFCVITEVHVCNEPNLFGIVETTDDEFCYEGMKHVYMSYCNWSCMREYTLFAFDRYTGKALIGGGVFNHDECEIEYEATGWAGGGECGWEVLCSEDYDGTVFVLFPDERRIGDEIDCLIDEIIDFSAGDCYFFSVTNE